MREQEAASDLRNLPQVSPPVRRDPGSEILPPEIAQAALALPLWTVGMHYFMELTPLLIVIPIVVLATRLRPPSACLIALVGIILASGLLWRACLR